jgi:hypothetical protein
MMGAQLAHGLNGFMAFIVITFFTAILGTTGITDTKVIVDLYECSKHNTALFQFSAGSRWNCCHSDLVWDLSPSLP